MENRTSISRRRGRLRVIESRSLGSRQRPGEPPVALVFPEEATPLLRERILTDGEALVEQ